MPSRQELESQARRDLNDAPAATDDAARTIAKAEALLADLRGGRMTARVLEAIRPWRADRAA